jgi:hypothetical protein
LSRSKGDATTFPTYINFNKKLGGSSIVCQTIDIFLLLLDIEFWVAELVKLFEHIGGIGNSACV